jgi:hypothetical protein
LKRKVVLPSPYRFNNSVHQGLWPTGGGPNHLDQALSGESLTGIVQIAFNCPIIEGGATVLNEDKP